MKGIAKIDDEELLSRCEILRFYDLENPMIRGNYYMFKVDIKVIKHFKGISNKQDPRDFAKYYLK